jgi:phosphoglycolate phosphatase-like HAD superfamily hydrolase
MYDGISELMTFIKGNDIKTGVATFAQRELAQRTLNHFKLDIDVIVGHERFLKKKPHPDSILKVLKKLNAEATETIGIGDKATDIQAYKLAKLALAVGCTWGLSSDEEIQELKNSCPDYIANHPSEIIDIICNC